MSFSQIPQIQSVLIDNLTTAITEKTKHPTTIQSVDIDWFDTWTLNKVQILDLDSIPLIEVGTVKLDFSFIKLLYNQDNYIHVEETTLQDVNVEMTMDSGVDSMNNMTKWIQYLSGDPEGIHRFDHKEAGDIHLEFDKVYLRNARYFLLNSTVPHREKGRFDVNDMEFLDINADVSHLKIVRDTIAMDIKNLRAVERRSKLIIKDLDSYLGISSTGLTLSNLKGDIGSSSVRGLIDLQYDDYTDYNDFYHCVVMNVDLKKSVLHTDDLSNFFVYFDSIHDYISGDVKLKGKVNSFKLKDTNLRFGGGSRIRGDFVFDKVMAEERTWMNLAFEPSYYYVQDLLPFIPPFLEEYISMFGSVSLDGNFQGTLDDFELDAIVDSEHGKLNPVMDISIKQEEYKGYLKIDSLDLGGVFGYKWLGELDFEGDIDGKGFTIDEMKLKVNAKVDRLGVNGYTYRNIALDSTYIKEKYFKGGLLINDPNLKFFYRGLFDFNDSTFDFKAGINVPNFRTIKLAKKDVGLITNVEASFDKVTNTGISGGVKFYGTKVFNKEKELNIERLMAVTKVMDNGLRLLNIESDFLEFNMAGFFTIANLSRDLTELYTESKLSILGNEKEKDNFYTKKKEKIEQKGISNYSVDAELTIINVNDLFSIFTDSVNIANQSKMIFEADFGRRQAIDAKLRSDHISFYGVELDSNQLNYFTEKEHLEQRFNTSINVMSKHQNINGVATKDFSFDAFSLDDKIIFDTKTNFYELSTALNLKGDIGIEQDSMIFRLPQSEIYWEGETWTTTSNLPSKVVVYPDGVRFQNFNLTNDTEGFVFLNGRVQKDIEEPLHIKANSLDLTYFEKYYEQDIKGTVDSIDVFIEDVFNAPRVYGHIDIDSLDIDDYYLGDVNGQSSWTKEALNVNLQILDSAKQKFHLIGGYYPQKIGNELDLKLEVNDLPIGIFQPFIDEVVEKLDGDVTGWIKISGTKDKPKLWGNVFAQDGIIQLVYLNVQYKFGDIGSLAKIQVRPNKIVTNELKVMDEYGHFAFINGGVNYQDGFKDLLVDLSVDFDDFFIMKKEEKGNDLFYGTAFGTGDINISGPFNDIAIDVNATTNKRTKIFIPLNAIDYNETDPYIVYIKSDSIKKVEAQQEHIDEEISKGTQQANFQVNMNLDITPDAYCEMIFDKKSGDIIRGNGLGKLQMKIDKNRDFEMFGNVEIVKGAYNFTMRVAEFNLVDKKFVINKGSTLQWNGDPFAAQMDIVAKYEQRVSLLPLIDIQDSTVRSAPEITKRYPVDVDLMIKGQLSAPELGFDIDIHDYPATVVTESGPISLESYVAGFEERIHRDEQELNRQVFGLIVLRQLLANDSYDGFGQTASSSVSELLTNQLSYILSQVNENFEVDLDMSGLDREALQNLQMRLSYTFAQGKVRVTRDGGFTDSQNQTTAASVLGDWTVEVVLSQDGALRAKFYQKYRQDVYITSTNQDNTSLTGASVMHTKSFDSFKQITSPATTKDLTEKPKGYRKHLRQKRREEKKKKKQKKHENNSE
ncbi:hypothetical protein EI427_11275 [Flammeovirga pectinis]|uniref:Translocation and assembly module TamB C-terminal domain-containing protein n=1 Tax=Flammeovirga pectinis TaxID=2494373 RepID=A0A3Q9FR35_9BACT|nr:translocation/assembly module TamB domain-containing protein [Flammeovirga pectinis]AZQ62792.1 hypothetical protein EI427_11275 [Flammeovirga pectinis]